MGICGSDIQGGSSMKGGPRTGGSFLNPTRTKANPNRESVDRMVKGATGTGGLLLIYSNLIKKNYNYEL
jgi:hypothetical protein